MNIGGCLENRTVGVIRSIRQLPSLTNYEIRFPEYDSDGRIPAFYLAEALTAVG